MAGESSAGGRFRRGASWAARALLAGVIVVAGCESTGEVTAGLMSPSLPDPSPAPMFKSEPEIRVRVGRGLATRTVGGPAQIIARQVGTSGKREVVRTPFTVTSGPDGIVLAEKSGARHVWPFGSEVELLPSEGDPLAAAGALIQVDGAKYPGFVTIRPQWNDAPARFDVVVTMPVEAYLPGVVTHELLPKWPRQTNEAQAVAARTYALHERARARAEGRPVDVESTTDDQVYASFKVPVAEEAVRATRGMVLTHDGKLLRAYFSSQCGGRPASAADVWPDYPFNRARPLQGQTRRAFCQQSSLHRWEVTRRLDDASQRLRAWGKARQHEVADMTRLRTVQIADRNDAGRPNRYRVTDDRGRVFVLKAEELRMGLNHPVPGMPPITKENRVHSGDLEAEVWADQVRFAGRGWGHGVGMCQWCAKGMADQGMDWNAMVRAFYPGAEVVKAY